MSAPPSGGGTPIENRRQLIEYFAAGNKPRADWRMGTEHETFGFDTKTLKPLPSKKKQEAETPEEPAAEVEEPPTDEPPPEGEDET